MKCLLCDEPKYSRGLCRKHYFHAYRTGTLDEVGLPKNQHSLTDVDLESSTAMCAMCGPTTIRRASRGRIYCKMVAHNQRDSQIYGNMEGYAPGIRRTLWELQDEKCAICETHITYEDAKLDHCHTGNRIRGVLCTPCNVGIGMLKESSQIMSAAIAYLNS